MRRGLRIATVAFVAVAAATAVVAIASGWERWGDLRAEARGFPWRVRVEWLSLALACAVGAMLGTARVWVDLFRDAGGRAETREGMAAWLGSNLGRYLPGKIWQLTGIAAYFRARGTSGSAGLATSLALQAVLLVTGTAVGVLVLREQAFRGVPMAVIVVAACAALAALHPRLLGLVVRGGARLLGETPPPGGTSAAALGRTGALALVIWLAYGAGLTSLLRGLASGVSLGLVGATACFAAAYVAGYVVLFAPGGLVVREGALAGLLALTTGMPLGAAGAIAVAARVWTTVAEMLAFAVAGGLGWRARGAGR